MDSFTLKSGANILFRAHPTFSPPAPRPLVVHRRRRPLSGLLPPKIRPPWLVSESLKLLQKTFSQAKVYVGSTWFSVGGVNYRWVWPMSIPELRMRCLSHAHSVLGHVTNLGVARDPSSKQRPHCTAD